MTSSQLADITVEWHKQVPSDWISYTDKTLDYSLKYPAKWYLYPGRLERYHGDWAVMPLYISSSEDKNHDKTAIGALPASNGNCTFILEPIGAHVSKSLEEIVNERRPNEGMFPSRFLGNDAMYLPQISTGVKQGFHPKAELWFVGPTTSPDTELETKWWMIATGQSETDSSDTCSDIFKTIMTSYHQPQAETTIDPAR